MVFEIYASVNGSEVSNDCFIFWLVVSFLGLEKVA
jgi:hypothetical protein